MKKQTQEWWFMAALEEGNNNNSWYGCFSHFLGKFYDISRRVPDFDVWVKFGIGKSLQNIQLKRVVENLGVATCRGLPFFHAFTGSDTTSSFKGKAKKSCWGTWKVFEKATPVFEELSQAPFVALDEESDNFKIIQKFVVSLLEKHGDRRCQWSKEAAFWNESEHGKNSSNMGCFPTAHKKINIPDM